MYHLLRSLYLRFTSKEEYSILLLGLDNAGKTTLLNQIRNLYFVHQPSKPSLFPSTTAPVGNDGLGDANARAGDTVPTVGQNVMVLDLPDMYLKIWDVGGQHSLRKLWQSYYKVCHAIVFVVDSTDIGHIDDLAEEVPGAGGPIDHEADEEDQKSSTSESKQPAVGGPINPSAQRFGDDTGRLDECTAVLQDVLTNSDTGGVPVLVLANKQDKEDALGIVRIKEGLVRPVFESEEGGMVRDSRVLPISALNGEGVRESVEWIRRRVVGNKETRPAVMR